MSKAFALLSAALPLQVGADVHLVPAGEFSGRDGRPGVNKTWKLPDAKGHALAARMTELHKRVQFSFDYEHQTFLSEENGKPAPASGWATNFAWRDGKGLFATDVKWTKNASQMIEGDEYRYISPAIAFETETGEVTGVVNASLTNIPNLEELAPVAQAIARLSAEFPPLQPTEQSNMNPVLKALLVALGLPESATETEATTAVATLRARADRVDGLNIEVATLKAATPDAAKYVPIEKFTELGTELATLKSTMATQEVDKAIEQAKAEGRVVADAVEQVWRAVGKTDIAQLRALISATPANPALAGQQQTKGKKTPEADGEASAEEIAICKNMGISVEDYRKSALVAQA